MNPPIGLLTPVKIGFARWLADFYGEFLPDTPQGVEWAGRGFTTLMVWAPGRMVDQAESMLSTWRRNNNSGQASTSAYLPVVVAAVAQDYTESPGEFGRPVSDKLPFSFPGDTLKRSFRVRLMHVDLRAQVVVMASEPTTASSIAMQLGLWASGVSRFSSEFTFAGQTTNWPVTVLMQDRLGIPSPVGEQMTIIGVDFTLRASLPLFYGSPEAPDVPDGYPVTATIDSGHDPATQQPAGVSDEQWTAFLRLTGLDPGNGRAGVELAKIAEGTEP